MKILLVEDNPAEACLTREALNESGVGYELFEVDNGVAATDFLNDRVKESQTLCLPDLILLDLNLPRKDGREVLREVKGDSRFSSIPVIVITNSQAKEDIEQVYQLRANCYLVKPPEIDEFFFLVSRVMNFWGGPSRLPRASRTDIAEGASNESSV